MFYLASPLFLITLVTLMVPIIIHFLSKGAGPVIKVGGIQFLETSESSRLQTAHLHEKGLLFLRALLLVLLILNLARPFWNLSGPTPKPGWIVVSPTLLAGPTGEKSWPDDVGQTIVDLVAEGHSLRLLSAGLPEWDLNQPPEFQPIEENVWSLLREADHRLAPGAELWVVTDNRLSIFQGKPPKLQRTVHWRGVDAHAANQWIEAAYRGEDGRFQVALAASGPERTTNSWASLALTGGETPDREGGTRQIDVAGDEIRLGLKRPDGHPGDDAISIPPGNPLEIAIYHDPDSRGEDAEYLRIAFEVLRKQTRLPLNVAFLSDQSLNINRRPSLVFWLSPQPVPIPLSQEVKKGGHLISDVGDRPYDRVSTWIVGLPPGPDDPPRLWRRADPTGGRTLWTDGRAKPLLQRQIIGQGSHDRLHTRFHPLWSDWVLHPAFPEWLWEVVREVAIEANTISLNPAARDFRVVAEDQAKPLAGDPATGNKPSERPMDSWFWAIAAACFLAERWWSERKPA